MSAYWALLIAAVLYGGLFWIRSGDKGGVIGRKIRDSDWLAWRDAVLEKENDLAVLRAAEPKRTTAAVQPSTKEK